MRKGRGWTQRELAAHLGTTQGAIARLEDSSYGRVSLQTLLKLSTVFDVGLNVRFGSFVAFLKDSLSSKKEHLDVRPFSQEAEEVGFVRTGSAPNYLIETEASSTSTLRSLAVGSTDQWLAIHSAVGQRFSAVNAPRKELIHE